MSKLMVDDLPLSTFLVNKQFRLYNQIRSRIKALEFQRNLKCHERFVSGTHAVDYYLHVNFHIQLLYGLLNRLENNSLICNSEYLEIYGMFKAFPVTIREHTEKVLGIYIERKLNLYVDVARLKENLKSVPAALAAEIQKDIDREEGYVAVMENVIEKMKDRQRVARKLELCAQVTSEAQLRGKQGWFIFMNTLTCTDYTLNKVFADNSKAWTDFIRAVDRCIGIEIYGSWRAAEKARKDGNEFHRYFAVVERGDKHGRAHVHCLHFARTIPRAQGDPNFGKTVPYNKELKCFNKFWRFGNLNTKIIRIDGSDAYAQRKWRWPVRLNEETGKYEPLQSRDADSVGAYLAKYLDKEFEKPCNLNGEVIKWRTRKSQGLGQEMSQKIVNKASTLQLELILRMRSSRLLKLKNKPLPMRLMKKLAMIRLMNLKRKQTPRKWWKLLMALKPREGFLKRLRRLIHLIPDPIYQKIGDLRIIHLFDTVGSSLLKLVESVSVSEFGPYVQRIFLTGSTKEVRYG